MLGRHILQQRVIPGQYIGFRRGDDHVALHVLHRIDGVEQECGSIRAAIILAPQEIHHGQVRAPQVLAGRS
jgi:hypothetical protein